MLLAQLTTNMAANVVSPANDFSSLAPKRISYVTGGLITAVIGIVMMPWKLYADAAAYIFTWLIGYSSLMGAIGGILIADYWVVRRQRALAADLFKLERALHATRTASTAARSSRSSSPIAAGRARLHPRRDDARRSGGESDDLRLALHLRLVRDVRFELRAVSGVWARAYRNWRNALNGVPCRSR